MIDFLTRIVVPIILLVVVVKIIRSKKYDLDLPLVLFMMFLPLAWLGYGLYITLYTILGG